MKLTTVAILLATSTAHAATVYVGPAGKDSNAGTQAAPFATPARAYAAMKGGDTLEILDGQYVGLQLLEVNSQQLYPPAGTAAAYTVVKAQDFGQVIIDGQGKVSPISMNNVPAAGAAKCQYIQFDGLILTNQAQGAEIYGLNHIKFTRVGFGDAGSGNTSNLALARCSYVLIEDCWGWGSGRYKFLTYHSDHVVGRRLVGRSDAVDTGGDPLAIFSCYASDSVLWQNCIAIDSDHRASWKNADEYGGAFFVPSTDGPSTNITWDSCIALNNDMPFAELSKNISNVAYKNCVGWHLKEGVWARDSATFDHMTIGDLYGPGVTVPNVGFQYLAGDIHPTNTTTLTNSIMTKIKGTALTGWKSEDFNDFYGNTLDRSGTPTGSHSVKTVPSSSFIADSRTSFGAVIRKQSGASGTLWADTGYNAIQSDELWPFPNEVIIGNTMRAYNESGLSGNRGFAATGQTLTNYIWTYLGGANPYGGVVVVPPPPPATSQPAPVFTYGLLKFDHALSQAELTELVRKMSYGDTTGQFGVPDGRVDAFDLNRLSTDWQMIVPATQP